MSNKALNPHGGKNHLIPETISLVTAGKNGFCLHQAWGIGIIRAYDEATKRFTIDFPEQSKKGHIIDVAFFSNGKIEILNPESILSQSYADGTKEKIAKLVADDVPTLIKSILAEYPTGECSSYALEAQLDRIYYASLAAGKDRATAFKNWWTKGRAAIRKDRAILIPERKGGAYALLEAPKDVGEDLFAQYEMSPIFERKIAILEELADSPTNETRSAANEANLAKVSSDLSKALKGLTGSRRNTHLPKILCAIWNRDKFFRTAVETVDTQSPTASEIIAESSDSDLANIALHIPHTSEKIRALLDLIRAHSGERWADRAFDLLRNRDIGGTKTGSAKLVSECISYLCDAELGEKVAKRFSEWLDSRDLRPPVIIWIIKNRESKKYAEIVTPLVNPNLLAAILSSIDVEALESNSTARIPLVTELINDKNILSDILMPNGNKVDIETIFDLVRVMLRNQGFDETTKSKLKARFHNIEPSVEQIWKSQQDENTTEESTLKVSKESKLAREAELTDIVQVKLPATKEAIQIAKEHGDLRENSEYKMARQDHDTLTARRGELEAMLKKAEVIDFATAKTDKVSIGTNVKLHRESDKSEITYTILGAWDGEPERNILAYITPLARQFLNKKAGEEFTTNIKGRTEKWKVLSITRWTDKK